MPARYDIKLNNMPARYKWGAILSEGVTVKGGKARMSSMTEEEKSTFQSEAAKARWKKEKENNGLRSAQRAVVSTHARYPKPLPHGV